MLTTNVLTTAKSSHTKYHLSKIMKQYLKKLVGVLCMCTLRSDTPITVVSICATERSFLDALDRTLVLRYNYHTNLTIEYQHISVQQDRCRLKTDKPRVSVRHDLKRASDKICEGGRRDSASRVKADQ